LQVQPPGTSSQVRQQEVLVSGQLSHFLPASSASSSACEKQKSQTTRR
jgi:hypothetical protein